MSRSHLPDTPDSRSDTMEAAGTYFLEDDDSVLSVFSRSPSPPSEFQPAVMPMPTPPPSQGSSRQTPSPSDCASSDCVSSVEEGEERPHKRRRITPGMPRDTKRIDLADVHDVASQEELDRLVKAIKTKRKIVVVAGAGISVSAGIPDFRSSTGLFNSLKSQHNLKGSGKQLFDAAVYRDSSSTSSFHQMVRQLSSETKIAKPTRFHHLLASLAKEGRLLRLYTQNVDGIDTSLPPLATQVPVPSKAPWPKTIQLHGGLSKMVCTKCASIKDFDAELFDGPIPPECKDCLELDDLRGNEGKRSHGIGKLRPRMVLYNEGNPDDEAIGSCVKADMRRRPDCIIVVGTTLKVPGIKRIVREMTGIVRDHRDGVSIWINNDPEPAAKEFENSWDIIVKGTSDDVAEHVGLRQWNDEEIGDIQPVTEEEVNQIKLKGEPKVVVTSPSKGKSSDFRSLPTPTDSPAKPRGQIDIVPVVVKKLTLTNNMTKNPASKGRSIDDLLPPLRNTLANRPAAARNSSKSSTNTAKRKLNGGKGAVAAPNNARLNFAPKKPIASSVAAGKGKAGQQKIKLEARAEPLAAVPSRENMSVPPRSSAASPAGCKKLVGDGVAVDA